MCYKAFWDINTKQRGAEMTLFPNRYRVTVTANDGTRHVGHAEHHLLIGPTAFLLKKKAAQVGVHSVEYFDRCTRKPPSAAEIYAE